MADKNLKLDPVAVHQRASSIPDCVELPQNRGHQSTTLSFLVGQQSQEISKVARLTVFCDTGTVVTSRFLQGTIRQTFRRNVTSLDALERLLRHPPKLISIDSSLICFEDKKKEASKPLGNASSSLTSETTASSATSSASIRTAMELLDCGVAILQAEREKVQSHLAALEGTMTSPILGPNPTERAPQLSPTTINSAMTSDQESGSASSRSSSPQNESSLSSGMAYSGMEFQFSLPPEPMKHVDQCLSDITSMGRLVRSVATNGRGTVFLYGNGGVAYTPNIPRGLYQKLSQLRQSTKQNSNMKSRPAYVSLGTRDRFFVTFLNGTFAYRGPKGLDRDMKKVTKPPRSVVFGISYETYFIVFHDGSWTCQGKDIPEALLRKLAERGDKPDLMCVNLGPAGEWFLRARNGRLWWGGISDDMDEAIQQLLDAGMTLNHLDFGEGGSYFISYD